MILYDTTYDHLKLETEETEEKAESCDIVSLMLISCCRG